LVVGENNQAQYRPIELGPVVDGLRVINGGLQAGEKIIIKGLVRPGMAVTPRMVPMQAPAAPAAGATGATKAAANAPAPAAAPAKAGGADPAKADGAAGSAEARK
ncbi:TPA: efflux transporter periplasmic adaptor subunit, partial [Pseudomonas aeruginosa]|nr:efflux transporter periplasmic adaptor subunit [Pseudomonas aeruginosa]